LSHSRTLNTSNHKSRSEVNHKRVRYHAMRASYLPGLLVAGERRCSLVPFRNNSFTDYTLTLFTKNRTPFAQYYLTSAATKLSTA
jgi:hypothetical protein